MNYHITITRYADDLSSWYITHEGKVMDHGNEQDFRTAEREARAAVMSRARLAEDCGHKVAVAKTVNIITD